MSSAYSFKFLGIFFNDTAPTEIYTLSLHDALPICAGGLAGHRARRRRVHAGVGAGLAAGPAVPGGGLDAAARRGVAGRDRKSTRLNSSHPSISYAVFCLKKKKKINSKEQHEIKRHL